MNRNEKMLETKKFPDYLQAVDDFVKAGFKYGEIVDHEWMEAHLQLHPSMRNYTLEKVRRYTDFRKELLENHQIALKTVPGAGYYVVPPEEQTLTALRDNIKAIQKANRQALAWCINTKRDELSETDKNINAIGIAAMQRSTQSANRQMRTINKEIEAAKPTMIEE